MFFEKAAIFHHQKQAIIHLVYGKIMKISIGANK